MDNKCIFCLSEDAALSSVEHIIPESLGGDELLPSGLVCDRCNKYFGREVENVVLTISPLGFARSFMSIKTKKKKYSRFRGVRFEIVGSSDDGPHIILEKEKAEAVMKYDSGSLIFPDMGIGNLARLMLKMGLELLASTGKYDVYDSVFDKARTAARYPKKDSTWKIAETAYKLNEVTEYGEDEQGPYERQTIYSYNLNQSKDKLIIFHFQYWIFNFIIPLTDGGFEHAIKMLNEDNPEVEPLKIRNVVLSE